MKNAYKILAGKPEGLGVGGRILSKCILRQ
jgi:hypothetical protein